MATNLVENLGKELEQIDREYATDFAGHSRLTRDIPQIPFTDLSFPSFSLVGTYWGVVLPAACAAYFGQWRGRWNTDGTNDMYLRVAEIKAAGDKCTVRYSFTSATSPVPARSVAEIKNDAISFVCNQNTGGTCIFSFRGNDTIDASYSNSMGGRNSGTFNRIK